MGIDWLHPLALAVTIDSAGTYFHAAGGLSGIYDYQFVGDPDVLFLKIPAAVSASRSSRRTSEPAVPGRASRCPFSSSIFGFFSIPAITGNPGNPEVFVKILDGTLINGEFWFFYGGLTDLEYTLTVTDQGTGAVRTYSKARRQRVWGLRAQAAFAR